jgi:type IV secretory pathway protease TraF
MVRGWIRFKQGRLQDAEALAQEAVRGMEQAVGVEGSFIARPLYFRDRVAQARDAWDDARLHASRAIRLRETYLPSEHPETNDARELVRELTGQASEQIIDRNRTRSIEARETSPASL